MLLLLLLTIALIYFLTSQKSFQRFQNNRCATKCTSVSSIYDCCVCQATGDFIDDAGRFERKFRFCMCKHGYKDYCYKPVTNFLLSQ